MILPVTANLKEIEEKGRNYQRVRPEVCVRCRGSRLWGHGFVESWFDVYVDVSLSLSRGDFSGGSRQRKRLSVFILSDG
ncbi:MAG: hypothetical protein JRI94_03310 [Deltaproteobacteria bacterium]|nr:hypothetical protein [Deltaproteobacteria bacterium]